MPCAMLLHSHGLFSLALLLPYLNENMFLFHWQVFESFALQRMKRFY